MTKHTCPNWKHLADVVKKLKPKEQVKFMYKFPNTQFVIKAIYACNIQKSVWFLFEKDIESIVIADKYNKILFEYRQELFTSNRIKEVLNHNTSISEQVILNWKNLSPKTRKGWLEAVLLESISQYEETQE